MGSSHDQGFSWRIIADVGEARLCSQAWPERVNRIPLLQLHKGKILLDVVSALDGETPLRRLRWPEEERVGPCCIRVVFHDVPRRSHEIFFHEEEAGSDPCSN